MLRRVPTPPSSDAPGDPSGGPAAEPGDFSDLATSWNEFGKTDPMWAVLSQTDKRGGKWVPGEFFASGRRWVVRYLGRWLGESAPGLEFGRAVDFGCGVGRVTQALAEHFQSVVGVDVAESMVAEANRYNRFPEKVEYHLNERTDLRFLEDASVDFVHTVLVLQHMPQDFAMAYLAEFGRILRPGGYLFFQIPTGRTDDADPFADTTLIKGDRRMRMFCTPMERIERVLRDAGVEIVRAEKGAGGGDLIESHHILARRLGAGR